MKLKYFISLLVIALIVAACLPIPGGTNTSGTPKIDKTNWKYEYYYYSVLEHTDTIGDFIRDNIMTYPLYSESWAKDYSHQRYSLQIPKQINIKPSDGIRFVMKAKNEDDTKDMSLSLMYGNSIIRASWNASSSYLPYCYLNVENTFWRNIANMNVSTVDYHEYELIIDSKRVSAKRDGVLAASFAHYRNLKDRINLIIIYPSGNRAQIDWVKLYKGNKLIMSEDFNTAGQTTAVWTLP